MKGRQKRRLFSYKEPFCGRAQYDMSYWRIKLTQGKSTILDKEDWTKASKFNWYVQKVASEKYYARRTTDDIQLSRFLMNPKEGEEIDHINGDSLDNRRSNLRICTHRENMMNRRKHKNNTSGHKGVSWHKAKRKWEAGIKINGFHKYLGRFDQIEDAVKAYKEGASLYYKEYA